MIDLNQGLFVISLDFELFWGIRDKVTLDEYGENILGVWEVVPLLLKLFKQYDVYATFATVGAIMAENKQELAQFLPIKKPSYQDQILSPYNQFLEKEIEQSKSEYFFAKKLVDLVLQDGRNEIGTHTFSHYYCLEKGQTIEEFEDDLQASIAISKHREIEPKSFVFPRHQLRKDYIELFPKHGINTYRGTEKAWYHSPARGGEESVLKRAIRYANYYFYLGAHHCSSLSEIEKSKPYNIPASMWLRPYREKWKFLDGLRLARIKNAMTYAAKNNKVYHLWWHPHEMGVNQRENFDFLEKILKHFQFLQSKYGFESKTMLQIAETLDR
ncbi:MAG: polysaccharide deacetylase family protein [Moheibacter sp.]